MGAESSPVSCNTCILDPVNIELANTVMMANYWVSMLRRLGEPFAHRRSWTPMKKLNGAECVCGAMSPSGSKVATLDEETWVHYNLCKERINCFCERCTSRLQCLVLPVDRVLAESDLGYGIGAAGFWDGSHDLATCRNAIELSVPKVWADVEHRGVI